MNKRIKDYPVAKNIICIEGCDLVGKTTIQNSLVEYYHKKEIEVLGVQSPGETVVGTKIREILKKYEMPPLAQECLFNASDTIIFDSFDPDINYIFDRYWISRIVYQYYLNRKFNYIESKNIYEMIERMISYGIKLPYNNIILLARDINILNTRASTRGKSIDIFERGGLERINNAYCNVVNFLIHDMNFDEIMKFHIFIIDDHKSIDTFITDIVNAIDFRE